MCECMCVSVCVCLSGRGAQQGRMALNRVSLLCHDITRMWLQLKMMTGTGSVSVCVCVSLVFHLSVDV